MFAILCILLGGVSGVFGIGVLVRHDWILGVIRGRYDRVSVQYRSEGQSEIHPAFVPKAWFVIFIGVYSCIFGVFALVLGLASV